MQRHLCLSLVVAALAAPALAGGNIVKCVDRAGHITLTDQPCEAGATMVRLASMPAASGAARAEAYPLAAEPAVLPPPRLVQGRYVMQRAKPKPLKRDVLTLKEARAQFLLMDAGVGTRALATLE